MANAESPIRATILVNTETSVDLDKLAKEMRDGLGESLLEAYPVSGKYDLIARLQAPNTEALREEAKKLRSYHGVKSTITMIEIPEYKTQKSLEHY